MGPRCGTAVCQLTCNHGAVANNNCTSCTACVGGWSGATCETWDASLSGKELQARYSAHFDQVNKQISGEVKDLKWSFSPLPGWLLFPDGLNPLTGRSTTPFIELSFLKKQYWTDGKGTKMGIPDQIKVAKGFTPALKPSPPTVLRSVTDVVSTQTNNLVKGSGVSGILGGLADPTALYDKTFAHDISLSVYDELVSVYSLQLQPGQLPLSRFAQAAIASLPDAYNSRTKPVFDLFIAMFGTRFPVGTSFVHRPYFT